MLTASVNSVCFEGQNLIQRVSQKGRLNIGILLYIYICVCERERERERESTSGQLKRWT